MLDARGEPGFVEEHRDELGVASERRVKALDGDGSRESADSAQPTEVYGGHASVCDLTKKDVSTDRSFDDVVLVP
jgi:hypothetical protein